METKKLERIIIIILALVNVFLLVVVLTDALEDRRSRFDTERSLAALLREEGITIGPGVSLLQDSPDPCTVARDLEMEERLMQQLLGDHASEDMGGSIWLYTGENSLIRIRGTGEMDMLFTRGEELHGKSPARAAEALMKKGGVSLLPVPWDSGETLEMCCAWNGCPVYNAVLTVDLSGERIVMIFGTMVFQVETDRENGAGMNGVTAMMRFLELIKSGTVHCGSIDGLSAGYLQTVAVTGEGTLTPVWRIVTDTGEFYLDAVTGGLVTLHS